MTDLNIGHCTGLLKAWRNVLEAGHNHCCLLRDAWNEWSLMSSTSGKCSWCCQLDHAFTICPIGLWLNMDEKSGSLWPLKQFSWPNSEGWVLCEFVGAEFPLWSSVIPPSGWAGNWWEAGDYIRRGKNAWTRQLANGEQIYREDSGLGTRQGIPRGFACVDLISICSLSQAINKPHCTRDDETVTLSAWAFKSS